MRLVSHKKTFHLIVLVISGVTLGAAADNQVNAEIISTLDAAVPGASATVGVLFAVPERAHIYWRNPGDSGLATGIDWDLSEDFAVGELQWPAPTQFSVEGLEDERYFGYTEETLLFAEVTIPDDAKPGTEIVIRANAYWLVCLDDGVCIPEDVDLELSIAIGSESKSSSFRDTVEQYRSKVPGSLMDTDSPIVVGWSKTSETSLTVGTKGAFRIAADSTRYETAFYPYTGGGWTMEFPESSALLSTVVFRPRARSAEPSGGVLVLSLEDDSESDAKQYAIEVEAPKTP